jgi:hypothetical protein
VERMDMLDVPTKKRILRAATQIRIQTIYLFSIVEGKKPKVNTRRKL